MIQNIHSTITSQHFIQEHRTDVRHFTRQRTLTFPILISFCLNLVKGSLQAELNTYFQHKNHERVPQRRVTTSAFCKARHKFSETAFIALNHQVTQQFYQQNPSLNWKGFRVLAVDGSQYLLPNTPALYETYGGMKNQFESQIPMASGSCLYDVFQGLVLDARLAPYRKSERDLAYQHLKYTNEKDLILYDRGYPAFWLFAAHHSQHFCMRVRENFNTITRAFVQSGKKEALALLHADKRIQKACQEKGVPSDDIPVRLLRIHTHKGDYILLTHLLNKRHYPKGAFKTLYHLRWQIEEGYKKQKSGIEMENFTGKSALAIQQDFHARILSLTLTAISLQTAQKGGLARLKTQKLAYKINFAHALSMMKNTLIHLCFDSLNFAEITQWLHVIGQSVSAIRPNRHFTRKKKVTDRHKHHMAYKRVL